MRLLVSAEWSFGRDRDLLSRCRLLLDEAGVVTHWSESDPDLNRTQTTFSGPDDACGDALFALMRVISDRCDINRHVGAHPRLGVMDECRICPLRSDESIETAVQLTQAWAEHAAIEFGVPVFLVEKSERPGREAALAALKDSGLGSLMEADIVPDFGPNRVHPELGVITMGVGDLLLQAQLACTRAGAAKRMAAAAAAQRSIGHPVLLGVRCLAWDSSQGGSRLLVTWELPDSADPDRLLSYLESEADRFGARVTEAFLTGAVRNQDLGRCRRYRHRQVQVLER